MIGRTNDSAPSQGLVYRDHSMGDHAAGVRGRTRGFQYNIYIYNIYIYIYLLYIIYIERSPYYSLPGWLIVIIA